MLSERVQRVGPSPTLAIDAKAKAMKAAGEDVINFGVGEPDFDTPDNIKEAAIRAIREGKTKYTPAGGIEPLKKAIVEKLRADNALDYGPDQVVVSCGAKHTLYNIAQAVYGPGDEVLIPSPYWVSYPAQVLLNDAQPVIVKTKEEDGFQLRPEALEEAITPRTKALILNSPSNPTGLAYDRATLERVAEVALKHNLVVVSDEIYEKLVYDGAEHVSIASLGPEVKERTILVNGISKSHAMTGWRIGYAAGPADVIKAMAKVQGQSTSNPTSIAQWAAVEAMTGPQDFLATMVAEFSKRRDRLVEGLNAMKGVTCLKPSGAFYAFPNVQALYGGRVKNSQELAVYLLDEAKVALVPGDAFGSEPHVRISYAVSLEDVEKALGRIARAVAELG
jgi:aspartate aminotransferase